MKKLIFKILILLVSAMVFTSGVSKYSPTTYTILEGPEDDYYDPCIRVKN
jgi:hypothetical protein